MVAHFVFKFLLWFVVGFHTLALFANLTAIFILPFTVPWYVAFPIDTLLINLMFSSVECPLTKLENRLRRGLGMPTIKYFVGHYFIWPARQWLRSSGRKKQKV